MTPISAVSGWQADLAGALLGLSLVAPAGPSPAILASATLRGRVRQAFLTSCGAICGDLCWLMLSVLGYLRCSKTTPADWAT